MGIFGNVKRNWNDGSLMAGLQSAGALLQGDYGTAAQIQGLHRQGLDERRQAEAKAQQLEAAVQALVARGVPEQEARIIAAGGGADTLLSQHNAPQQQGDEWAYEQDNAGNLHRYNKRTGAFDPNPVFVDPNPRQIFDPAQNRVVTIPNTYAGGQQPAPAQQQGGNVINAEMYRGATNGLGAQGAADWAQRNNIVVAVRSPQEARQLPSGTRIRLPDGSIGRVP